MKRATQLTSNVPSNKKGNTSVSDGVLINLRRIIQSIDLHSRQLARQHGITTPQLLILKQIQGETGMTVSQLAKQISLKQATVTDILNRLERKGLVRRSKDTGDRRRVLIEETAAGQKLLDAAPSPLQETFLEKFEELETWQQSMILSALQLLVTSMVEEDISAAPILSTGVLTDKVELTYEDNAAQKEEMG
jgi:DNA-binding MarR family transcriptional regulator